jgi:hypothetical protein
MEQQLKYVTEEASPTQSLNFELTYRRDQHVLLIHHVASKRTSQKLSRRAIAKVINQISADPFSASMAYKSCCKASVQI